MTIEATAVTVATTATLLATGGHGAARSTPGSIVTIKPVTAGEGALVFVGPAGVTTAIGMPLGGGMSFAFDDDEALYGIVASGTVVVRVLEHT